MFAATISRDGSRVDDRAAFLQVRQRGSSQKEKREDVRAEGAFQLLFGDLQEIVGGMLFGGVVDDDVEAVESSEGLFHDLLAESFFADVAGDQQTFAAFFL